MTNTTKLFANISFVAVVALLFAGCTLFPGKSQDSDTMYRSGEMTGDNPAFTEVSEDDSLETTEAELDATVIEDEDFSDLEAELNSETDTNIMNQ